MPRPSAYQSFALASFRILLALGILVPALRSRAAIPPPEPAGKIYDCKPGPWGTLHYFYIYLEAPESVVDRFATPNSVPRWCFPGGTLDQVKELLTRAGVGAAAQEAILNPKLVVTAGNVLCVFPPLKEVEALTPEQRTAIYPELAKSELNEFQQNPVFIQSGSVEEWLRGTELRDELKQKISSLTYKRGEALVFSDPSVVLNYVRDDKEARYFFKVITRTRAIMARLELKKGAEAKAAIDYWTGHGRLTETAPILQSIIETEGLADLPLSRLLPPLPRQMLYTFPPPEAALEGRLPDCHWTTLNFFNYRPKEYYRDTRLAANRVLQTYAKVDPPYEFGDLLMFMDQTTGEAFHSCVYIAEEIVFTKNGENAVQPWVLSKISDVQRIYSTAQNGVVQAFRVKETAQ
jgi:hypothetical protein